MKWVAFFLGAVTLLILISCTTSPVPPSNSKTPMQLAEDLIETVLEMLEDPPQNENEAFEALSQILYIPSEDATEVKDSGILSLASWIMQVNFLEPSTVTNIEVLSVTELEDLKFFPWIVSDKPDFVDRVFILNLFCEFDQSSTQTICSLPMITIKNVDDKSYFLTIFAETTNGSTEVKMYPQLPPLP